MQRLQVLKAMVLGPPTTAPPIPTRTADPFAAAAAAARGGGAVATTTAATTTTTKPVELSSALIAKNQLSLQAAVAS
jgi:hypothetical protein